jgi:membrane-associated HD superfamily phosphohydrolase
METNFYVVGDNRGTAFFLRNIKFFIWLLLAIIFALSITIAYLYFTREFDQELLTVRIQREKTRSESLVNKLKQTGQQDSDWEQQVLSQSSQNKKLNEQQAALLERQRNELNELNSILKQREQVVRQFQLEKTSSQEQINNLQLKVRSLQQQLLSAQTSLTESIAENEIVQAKITELDAEKNKLELKLKKPTQVAATIAPVKIQKSQISDNSAISVKKLKINRKNSTVSINYNLTNNSNRLQLGRTGMYLSSKKNLEKDIPFRLENSTPFRIKRYRIISRNFSKVKAGSFVRILIWNDKKELIIDNAYPIK